jgi:hypothetical protein
MTKYLLSFLFCFNAFAGEHPYDPLQEGDSITYHVYKMTGIYNDTDMRIATVTNNYIGAVKITFVKNNYADYGTKNLIARYYHGANTPLPSPLNFSTAVQDAKWITNTNQEYIGEMVNELGNVIIPPEAKLERNPVVGNVIDKQSVVRVSPSDNTIINANFHWKYRTIEYLPVAWGNFIDCWRTGLREYNPAGNDRVYNYLFMKNKGMVNFWYGDLIGNQVTGHQFYAVDY